MRFDLGAMDHPLADRPHAAGPAGAAAGARHEGEAMIVDSQPSTPTPRQYAPERIVRMARMGGNGGRMMLMQRARVAVCRRHGGRDGGQDDEWAQAADVRNDALKMPLCLTLNVR